MNNGELRKLRGANMDIDLASPPGSIPWQQDACPWTWLKAIAAISAP